jgi:hypothetical protein
VEVLYRTLLFFAAAIDAPFPAKLDHAPTPEKHLIETMPGGVALADFDNDGVLDAAFANGAGGVTVHRGPRFETHALPVSAYAIGLAAGDYDGDGMLDLFVAGVQKNYLFHNEGGLRFRDVTKSAGLPAPGKPWSVAGGWFDYDRDGKLDLFVVRYVDWDPAKERFCGDPTRKLRQYCHPRFYSPQANTLYRNRGDGTFEDVSGPTAIAAHKGKGMSLAFLDYDDDGWTDVFVTNDTEPSFLFRNVEGKRFEESALLAGVALPDAGKPVSAMGVAAADFDGDGRGDLVYTALMGETFPVFFGSGKGLFTDRTFAVRLGALTRTKSGWSILAGDFDNDGKTDLFTANGDVNDNAESFGKGASKQQCMFLRNVGGRFEASDVGSPAFHRGAAVGDLNNDGALDVVVSRLGETPFVIWGSAPKDNHWLRVRAPLGTRIRVGGRREVYRVETACGYVSSCEPVAHIGLGATKGPLELTLTPPHSAPRKISVPEPRVVISYRE